MSTSVVVAPPTVNVGGKPYAVRFSNGAFYLLSTWGIDLTSISAALNEKFQSGHYTEAMFKLAASSLGSFDRDGNWTSLGMEPLKLADTLLDGEAEPLLDAVWKAFAGKLGLGTKTAAPEPADSSTNADGSTSGPSEPASTDSALPSADSGA